MFAATHFAPHQPGRLQHADVARDAGERHRKGRCQVGDAGVTLPQRLQQPSSGRVCERAIRTPFPVDAQRAGQSVSDVIAERTKAFAVQRGVDLNWASTDQVMRLHQYNVFPNMSLLTNADHLIVLVARPGSDPDHGELVMILWTRTPPDASRIKPADMHMKAEEAHPGLVLTQDIAVFAGLQRGLHQPGFTDLTLSNEERRVINMHSNLERYLHLPESQCMTGGQTP